jgi:hypothetical protein
MKNKRIPRWKLERFRLGELSAAEMDEIRRRAGECPEIREEIEALSRADEEFLAQNPPEAVLPQIARRMERLKGPSARRRGKRRAAWPRLLVASPIAAAVLAALFIIFREPSSTRPKGDSGIDTTKTQIVIYKKTAEGSEILKPGALVRAGDLLQLAYVPAGKTFGVIASLDGNGGVTLHFPESRAASARLRPESLVRLATSYELDDAPRYECFFFITAREEIDVAGILDRLKALDRGLGDPQKADLGLPPSYGLFSILLKKGNGQ